MENNLSQIYRIQAYLKNIKYPDEYRVAREISSLLDSQNKISEREILDRLHKDEPWEYIRGYTIFCGNKFRVTQDTLIPRVETEQLVYECSSLVRDYNIKNIIDVGTGSGSITLSLVKELKDSDKYTFYATDISSKALEVAKYNEREIIDDNRVKWVNSNLIDKVEDVKGATLIIANLPYIPTQQYLRLDRSVREYEPRIALDGGADGLEKYQTLLEQISQKEIDVKFIYIETEESIFTETRELLKEYYPNSKLDSIKDCFRRNRFLLLNLLQSE